jgi:hypothetical protein
MAKVETAHAKREARETFTFTIQLDVDPREVREYFGSRESAETLLKSEFESWLESLAFVREHDVRRRT